MGILKNAAKQNKKNPKPKKLQSHFNAHYNPVPSHLRDENSTPLKQYSLFKTICH